MDGIQACGAVPLNMKELELDYMAVGGHKWLMGLEGAGFLYVQPEKAPLLHHHTAGWISHEDPFRFLTEGAGHLDYGRPLRTTADQFEGGTLSAVGFAALGASVPILLELGVETIYRHANTYLDALESGLSARGFQSLRGPRKHQRSCILALACPTGISAPELNTLLKTQGVIGSTPDGMLRFAPHWPNALAEVPRVLEAVDRALAQLAPVAPNLPGFGWQENLAGYFCEALRASVCGCPPNRAADSHAGRLAPRGRIGNRVAVLSIDLKGRHALVAGVADEVGFGFAIAKKLFEAGARVSIGVWPPAMRILETRLRRGKLDDALKLKDGRVMEFEKLYPLDAAYDQLSSTPAELRKERRYAERGDFTIQGLADRLREDLGGAPLDVLVHSLANGPEVSKPLLQTSRNGYLTATSVSAYSMVSMVQRLAPLMGTRGAVVSLTYLASERVIHGYGGGMHAAKAALESDTRVLAYEAGRKYHLRINTISAWSVSNPSC